MIYSKLRIKRIGKQRRVFAKEAIQKGRKILDFPGRIVSEEESGEWDLQTGKNKFIRALRKNQIDNFLNHSCRPNSYVKQTGKKFYLLALKSIRNGEEITFDYDTTDYDNEDFKFVCGCGAPSCRKIIRGFKYLNKRRRMKLRKFLVPYLKEIFEKKGKKNFN